MKTSIQLLFIYCMVLSLQSCLMSCNNCNCKNDNTVLGYYVCERLKTKELEYLLLLPDSSYIHIFDYDSIVSISSSNWFLRKGEISDLTFNKWMDPFYYSFVITHQDDNSFLHHFTMEEAARRSKKAYKYGCYSSYKRGCIFRIYFSIEDIIYFRRIQVNLKQLQLSNKPIHFYSDLDSTNFYKSLNNNGIELK